MTQEENESFKPSQDQERDLKNAQLAEEFTSSEFWKKILSPYIDAVIHNISGKKKDGFWMAGEMAARATKPDDFKYLSGYEASMIELSMFISSLIRRGEKIKKQSQEQEDDLLEDYNE